jgi:adenylyltransferase/sulfurtransferase
LGVLPGVIGTLQATEAIKLLTSTGQPMIGRLLIYDGLDLSFTTVQIARDPDCPVCSRPSAEIVLEDTQMACAAPAARSISCSALLARLASADELLLVDVRQPVEWSTGMIPGALALSRPDLDNALERGELPLPRERDLVLVCQSGMRSQAAIASLLTAGYDPQRLFNLEQGMNAWTGDVHLAVAA